MSKKRWIAIICVLLMALICFVALPIIDSRASAENTETVLRARKDIPKGTIVSPVDVEQVVVGATNLPAGTLQDGALVVGKYAAVDISQGDYFFPAKLSSYVQEEENTYSNLEDGTVAVTVSAPSMTGKLGNKIQKGDIVTYMDKEGDAVFELQYVRIDYIQNNEGTYLEEVVGDASLESAMLTFIISKEQADFLSLIESNGKTGHFELVSRGDPDRAERLLAMQEDMLAARSEFRSRMLDGMVDSIFDTYNPDEMSFYEWYSAVVELYHLSDEGFVKAEDSITTKTVTSSTNGATVENGFDDWVEGEADGDMKLHMNGTSTTTITETKASALAKEMANKYYEFMGENFEAFRNNVRFLLEKEFPGTYWDGYIDWDTWRVEWEDQWYKDKLASSFLAAYDEHTWAEDETFGAWFTENVYPILEASKTTDCDEVVVDGNAAEILKKHFAAYSNKKPAEMKKVEVREELRGALESYLTESVFGKATDETVLITPTPEEPEPEDDGKNQKKQPAETTPVTGQ